MKTKPSQPPTAAEVAAYFQENEHTDYQARMIRECGQRVKTYPFERVITNPHLLACHHRFCPDCQRRRAQNWGSALRAVIDEESMPASKTDSRLGPHWVAITLPGVPCAASELGNQLGTLIEQLSIASDQPFWRYNIKTALRLLTLEADQPEGQSYTNIHMSRKRFSKPVQRTSRRTTGSTSQAGLDSACQPGELARRGIMHGANYEKKGSGYFAKEGLKDDRNWISLPRCPHLSEHR